VADNVIFQSAIPATPPAATVVSTEEITTLNGAGVSAQHVQRTIPAARTADGAAIDLVGQKARAQSLPTALSTEDAALLADLLTITAFQARIPAPALLTNASATPTALAAGVYPLIYNGATWDFQRTPVIFKPFSLTAATAEVTIWTPSAGKKFRLMGFVIGAGAATTILFNDNTGGTLIFTAKVTTGIALAVNLGNGILSAVANNVLTVTRGTSGTLDGTVFGTEE